MSLLRRRLNVFDLTLITIGSIIGSGIFRNPALVANRAHLPALAIGSWVAGGIIAVIGAFVFAELAARRPVSGGLYAYLRDAYHPVVGFVFGWTLLLIADTGGTAASAVLFSGYLTPLTGMNIDTHLVAVVTLAVLVGINCLGVRQGGTWQNVLVIFKVAAIAALIAAGLFAHPSAGVAATLPGFASNGALLGAFGIAMIPVLFAYNGFQGASYITGETIEPQRTIPRGLIYGVVAVMAIYVLVNIGCLRVLGPAALAASKVPASDVMQAALGSIGARVIAIAIALSTLGFMSTRMLVTPRIYHQMAADGNFFKQIAWVSPRTHVPTVAIVIEGVIAAIIAISGTFEQIVNWVVAPEWIFVVLAGGAIFIFRKRDGPGTKPPISVPLHPYSTMLLMAALLAIFASQVALLPLDTLYGTLVIVAGIVFYYAWKRFAQNG
ncbi:MAG TPA: amino acid permease [Candidatus Baltobacteraceae bacterium]|nr:amino acid permease [Candidatus Baltobacteraceae bacterium]